MNPHPPQPTPTRTAAHTVMFWSLTTLALAAFVPCVLMPVWMETETARRQALAMEALVAELEADVARNDAQIAALRADPLVNDRVVRRELNYRPTDEQLVQWPATELASLDLELPEMAPAASRTATAASDATPAWLATLTRWLPDWPWRELFANPANRTILLLMSGGLLIAAFVLYSPTRSEPGECA